ncbi:hypothetical protein [Desulfosporosinus youngiae]|uniref:Zinc-ribbon domain-containing protein n=1 Tax=Desulfosporosinus youngiae DSM 17734 TaxID=768710 RepID=H5Y235_9FIRM|nr:hypothetical protein [Desulfosporosinus youngiae]EHQ88233.1 hypothetical protein DesyoDRAFT_1062 [Desulfosporosinus youngiae DSM 17734]
MDKVSRIEIQATKHSKVYAKIDGCKFSVGLISDINDIFPGHKPKDCKPFYEIESPVISSEMPESLYSLFAQRLETPTEWILGNELVGIDDKPYRVPTCPTCKEPTYGESKCPFCGQALTDHRRRSGREIVWERE